MTRTGILMRRSGIVALLALGSCGPDALLGPEATQGIEGTVLIGPQCPVQQQGNPCPDLPYEASLEIRVRDGASVTRVRSESDGTFRVGLRPGSYTIRPQSGSPFPVATAQDVEVVFGSYAQITISFDTGIR